jgi:hypothetical protein
MWELKQAGEFCYLSIETRSGVTSYVCHKCVSYGFLPQYNAAEVRSWSLRGHEKRENKFQFICWAEANVTDPDIVLQLGSVSCR